MSAGSIGGTIHTAAAELGVAVDMQAVNAPASLLEITHFLSAEVAVAERAVTHSVSDPAKLAALHPEFQRTAMTPETNPSTSELRRLHELSAEIHSLVDEDLLYGAAARLGAAIDAAIPALKAIAASSEASGGTAPACDLVNTPAVCIGGLEPNTYTADMALLIDLGGNDTYRNSAGGADPSYASATEDGNGLPVSVNIDIAGNDTYSTTFPTASGAHFAQGAAFFGGIGILLDAGGNDVYEARSLKEYPESLGALGQGFAEYAGVGVLADVAGNDSYHLDSRSWNASGGYGITLGHGLSGAGAIGALLDGSGNDSYLVEHEPTPKLLPTGELHLGAPTIISSGAAAEGAGIFADGGGNDSMRVSARTAEVPAGTSNVVSPNAVYSEAFGFSGLGGVGVSLSGDGRTSWEVSGRNVAPDASGVADWAFGASSIGAFAAHEDLGGDDIYTVRSVTVAESEGSAAAGCDCEGANATARAGQTSIVGGGYGQGGGVAVMADRAGNDLYSFIAESTAEATAHDDRESGGSASSFAQVEFGVGINALGYGSLAGAGFALDGGGDDRYLISAVGSASATSTADDPQAEVQSSAESGFADLCVLGASTFTGHGDFADLGGRDVYDSSAASVANASPETSEVMSVPITAVFGSVDTSVARFSDIDGGAADVFGSLPADPACEGVKGQDYWVDCGTGLGIGINR